MLKKQSKLLLTICFAVGIGLLVSFLGIEFIRDIFTSYRLEPEKTVEFQNLLESFIQILIIISSILIGILIYLYGAETRRTKTLAYGMLKDVVVSQTQFKTLYEYGPVPYLLINPHGEIEEPNKATLRFFKTTPENIEHTHFFQYLIADDTSTIKQIQEDFRRGLPLIDREVRIKTINDTERWILVSLLPLDGEKKGYGIATLIDITERKEIDRAKTEFVSLAAHQLRTPLATLNWYTQMLMDDKNATLTPNQEKYISRIGRSTKDMADLVSTLLNVSRLEMGKLAVSYETGNISDVAESIFDEFAPDIEEKQLSIEKQYEPQIQFTTDHKLFRIILQNLISNAIKYTPEKGSVKIHITKDTGLSVSVTDTGFGIPAGEQDKIFSKLFRANNVRQKISNGNGLGLYMTKSLVETLGGTIRFTSEIDKGTTFYFDIPEQKTAS